MTVLIEPPLHAISNSTNGNIIHRKKMLDRLIRFPLYFGLSVWLEAPEYKVLENFL